MDFPGDEDAVPGPTKMSEQEQEINRLQELCIQNFAKIDELKKEKERLLDVQTELKETTSDLAFSLAECPWWKEDNMSMAIRILASYTQKVQYILGLPTFIDPVEQLEKKGRFNNKTIKMILNNNRPNYFPKKTYKCRRCKKSFVEEKNFNKHKTLHKQSSSKTRLCKCGESFPSYLFRRHQHQGCKQRKLVKKPRIIRYIKCGQCQATFVSLQVYYKHLKDCRNWQSATNKGQQNGIKSRSGRKNDNIFHNKTRLTFPLTGQVVDTSHYNGDGTADSPITIEDDENSDANSTEMLNCSLSNLIARGVTISVLDKPNGTSNGPSCRKYDKTKSSKFSDSQGQESDSCYSSKVNNFSSGDSASKSEADLHKPPEYNGNETNMLDESSKGKPEMYKCQFCEFRTTARRVLVSHNTSQCRWRHFVADQIPFLKTLQKMSFDESNSSKDPSAADSIADLECNDGLIVVSLNKRCRQRSSTL